MPKVAEGLGKKRKAQPKATVDEVRLPPERTFVPDPTAKNPFAAYAGLLADDPDYDEFMDEIRKYRDSITREYNAALDVAGEP